MKLSDFKGEEAVDVLAKLMVPAVSIATDEEVQKIYNEKTLAELFVYIMDKYKKHVLDIYEVLCKDKAKNATPAGLLKMFSDIMTDDELRSLFFASRGQNEQETHSGSATENTED